MKPFFETVTPEPGASWAFLDRRLQDGIPFEWHHHPEYELTLTLNSRGYRYVGDDVEPYGDRDLVLVGPGIPHSWCSNEAIDPAAPHVALVAWFTRDWATGLTGLLPELRRLGGLLARAERGVCFSPAVRDDVAPLLERMRTGDPAERLVLLLQTLTRLCRDDAAMEMANAAPLAAGASGADPRLARVLDHLHEHFAEPVSVARLAGIACVSPSTLHRMFRRQTRSTVLDYVIRLRIGRACAMLIHEHKAIATIAADVGYTNLSLFNRQFVRLKGETPRQFRGRHRALLGGG